MADEVKPEKGTNADKAFKVGKPDIRKDYKKTYNERAIVIKIMPRTLERFILGVVILLLILVLVFQKGCSFEVEIPTFSSSEDTPALSAVDSNEEEASEESTQEPVEETEEASETESDPPEQDPEPEPTEDTSSESVEDVEALTENLKFSIDYTTDGNKIDTVSFDLENGDYIITPRVRVYWYDSGSNEKRKEFVRAEYTYSIGLSPGQEYSKTFKESDFTSKYFETIEEDTELLVVELIDLKTNKVLLEESARIDVE